MFHPNSDDTLSQKAYNLVGVWQGGPIAEQAGTQGNVKSGYQCQSGLANVCEELCWYTYWYQWEDFEGIWVGQTKPIPKEFMDWLGKKGKYPWANVISAFSHLVEKIEKRGPVQQLPSDNEEFPFLQIQSTHVSLI